MLVSDILSTLAIFISIASLIISLHFNKKQLVLNTESVNIQKAKFNKENEKRVTFDFVPNVPLRLDITNHPNIRIKLTLTLTNTGNTYDSITNIRLHRVVNGEIDTINVFPCHAYQVESEEWTPIDSWFKPIILLPQVPQLITFSFVGYSHGAFEEEATVFRLVYKRSNNMAYSLSRTIIRPAENWKSILRRREDPSKIGVYFDYSYENEDHDLPKELSGLG